MPARTLSIFVVCAGVCLAGVRWSQAQEATSASLPDQFQTGEMIQIQKPNKRTAQASSRTVATAPKQDSAPVPEEMPLPQESPAQIAPAEQKRAEPSSSVASSPPSQKPPAATAQTTPEEEPAVVAVPSEKKHRARKRQAAAVKPQPANISAPVPMSLSVAQSMAITAPVPEYSYQMKRRNLSGNGVCVVTVDLTTGAVTNATMVESTSSPLLDKLTTQTFKSWRFKPGTVSQVRIPISYE